MPQYAWNFIHSAFALALLHQARGRQDTANELGESVVYYALQTNHPLMLKFARAFQAELALRQGRFAEVSRWQEQFVTGPLAPMYRFYVPQLTLTKVLLAPVRLTRPRCQPWLVFLDYLQGTVRGSAIEHKVL